MVLHLRFNRAKMQISHANHKNIVASVAMASVWHQGGARRMRKYACNDDQRQLRYRQ